MHVFLFLADQKEFLKLCQAVGIGFGVMGAVGFIVKLSTFLLSILPTLHCSSGDSIKLTLRPTSVHIPLNGLLVGSA
jgi:hypothetical protein